MKINILLTVLFILTISSCTSTPLPVNAGSNESIVVIRNNAQGFLFPPKINIWLNDEIVTSGGRGVMQFVIPNGEHTIQAGSLNISKGNVVKFSAEGEEILFMVNSNSQSWGIVHNIALANRKRLR